MTTKNVTREQVTSVRQTGGMTRRERVRLGVLFLVAVVGLGVVACQLVLLLAVSGAASPEVATGAGAGAVLLRLGLVVALLGALTGLGRRLDRQVVAMGVVRQPSAGCC